MTRKIRYIIAVAVLCSASVACTNLDEELFSSVTTGNYYNTARDVKRMIFRPFEHAFWSIQSLYTLNELTADQLVTVQRDGWWDDGGSWRNLHYHTYDRTSEGLEELYAPWLAGFQGVGECNFVVEELNRLDLAKFGFTDNQISNYKAQIRALRAWFYLRLFDTYRYLPLVVSFYDQSLNTKEQVEPEVIFKFIEKELKESLEGIGEKSALGTQSQLEGLWTKAGVASMLVRLYLNAEVYIGEDHFADCETYARNIVNGEYGPYKVADRWDAIFDWDNDTCDEMILGFPSKGGYTYWHYSSYMFWDSVPHNYNLIIGDTKSKPGIHNCKYAASPSYDLYGNLYTYSLGMPVQKFRKYPGDYRMTNYRNLGNSRREGMFVYGYLEYKDPQTGQMTKKTAPERAYTIYIRDAIGQFQGIDPEQWPSDKASNMRNGDHNSGWHYVKYPLYADGEEGQLESDWAEIRLPEIIYSLAECLLRKGETTEAAELLNDVRRRNYPEEKWPEVLYAPEGTVTLDMDEMLDEWGREFFAEGRRRIDLIRFGKFSSGRWWDKTADADDHWQIFPLTNYVLNLDHFLKQVPGYN